jgi:hypothetical protein
MTSRGCSYSWVCCPGCSHPTAGTNGTGLSDSWDGDTPHSHRHGAVAGHSAVRKEPCPAWVGDRTWRAGTPCLEDSGRWGLVVVVDGRRDHLRSSGQRPGSDGRKSLVCCVTWTATWARENDIGRSPDRHQPSYSLRGLAGGGLVGLDGLFVLCVLCGWMDVCRSRLAAWACAVYEGRVDSSRPTGQIGCCWRWRRCD